MKTFITSLAMVASFFVATVHGHGDHAVINDHTAIQIVAKSIQKMTFKDHGYEVGKIDSAWKDLNQVQVKILEKSGGFYIVQANSLTTKKDLFFKLQINGELVDVKSSNNFK